MFIGRGISKASLSAGFEPYGTAPRVVLAGSGNVVNMIWTMELGGTALIERTTQFLTNDISDFVQWDGSHFFIGGSEGGSNVSARIQRSSDGITWTLVADVTVVAGGRPIGMITDGSTHYCLLYNQAADANWAYLKSTDGGATWSSTPQYLAVSGTTAMNSQGIVFDPDNNEFILFNYGSAGVHIRYDMELNEIARFPGTGTINNYFVSPRYWPLYNKFLGKTGVTIGDWDLYSMPDDLSANRTLEDTAGYTVGGSVHANTVNQDAVDWYANPGAINTIDIRKGTDGDTWAIDHTWSTTNQVQTPLAHMMAVSGDKLIVYHKKSQANATSPEVRVSWDGGTTWNTYNLPGVFGSKGDGVIGGVV